MNEPRSPGFMPTPTPVAAALIGAAVRILPVWARNDYSAEFRAQSWPLPRVRQIIFAASILRGAPALRHALAGREHPVSYRSARRRRLLIRRGGYVAGLLLPAVWLPAVAVLLMTGLVMAWGVLAVPTSVNIDLFGPGYQYRQPNRPD